MSWIGVDFDGTLCTWNSAHCGEPVPAMVTRVLRWVADGFEVRVVTARAFTDGTPELDELARVSVATVKAWCLQHLGVVLPVTCQKDYGMLELWDDRARQVEKNTGVAVAEYALAQMRLARDLARRLPLCPDHRGKGQESCVTCERDEALAALKLLADAYRGVDAGYEGDHAWPRVKRLIGE